MSTTQELQNDLIILEPASEANVDILVRWTLDRVARPSTRSVFAYTAVDNHAERRALQKAGLRELGPLPHPRYPVPIPEGRWLVYSTGAQAGTRPA